MPIKINIQEVMEGVGIEKTIRDMIRSFEEDGPDCSECKKAVQRLYVLECATPMQFTQIWDRTLKGEKFLPLIDELGKIQEELSAMARAKERQP